MIEFLKKYNLYVFILIIALLTVYDIANWDGLSTVRKLVNLFGVLAILHEVEEKYWPGGFHELMMKKFNVNISDFDAGRANLAVFIFWIAYLALGYIFDSMVFFFLMTVVLSLFEAFIHTAGIKIHNLDKPYTPGMLTAWMLAVAAIYSIITLNGVAGAADYVIAFVLFVLTFMTLTTQVQKSAGITRSEMIEKIRK